MEDGNLKVAEVVQEIVDLMKGLHRLRVVTERRAIITGDDGRNCFGVLGGVDPLGDEGMSRSKDGVGDPGTEGGVG